MKAAGGALTISGGCHCGKLGLELDWPESEPLIAIRECQCSFCRKHGGAWTSHRDARLTVSGNVGDVSRYRFGTGTAEFHICRDCGVAAAATSDVDGRLYAVVNVNALDLPDSIAVTRATTDFDTETKAERLERRARNWIPEVSLLLQPAVRTRS